MTDTDPLSTPVTEVTTRLLLGPNRPSVRLGPPQTTAGTARLTLTHAPGPAADIHLGCLWQTVDGESGAMQSYGGRAQLPRSGPALATLERDEWTQDEHIVLDLAGSRRLHRLVCYLYAVSGRPDWARLAPVLTLHLDGGGAVEMPVGQPPPGTTICAITSIHQVADTLVVRREAEYLRGQQSNVALAYDFEVTFLAGQPPANH